MFFHANYLFSYQDFAIVAACLNNQINQGNLAPLYEQTSKAYQNANNRQLFSQLGFGKVPSSISEFNEDNMKKHQNIMIGQYMSWVLVQYLSPVDNHLGYQWNDVSGYLQQIGWPKTNIDLLLTGLPIGNLLGIKVKPKKLIDEADPYWYWIRPRYSYNQGGFIPLEKCRYLLTKLRKISSRDFDKKIDDHQKPVSIGLNNIMAFLEKADKFNIGVYSAIYWEWENEK